MTRPHPTGTGTANPWVWQADDYQANIIQITLPWDPTTRALQNGTVFRDAACVYVKIYIGVGTDGTPDTTPNVFTVPAGTTTLRATALAAKGLNTIDDVTRLQITAGP